jgi:hypothetical protein
MVLQNATHIASIVPIDGKIAIKGISNRQHLQQPSLHEQACKKAVHVTLELVQSYTWTPVCTALGQ